MDVAVVTMDSWKVARSFVCDEGLCTVVSTFGMQNSTIIMQEVRLLCVGGP